MISTTETIHRATAFIPGNSELHGDKTHASNLGVGLQQNHTENFIMEANHEK